MNGSNGPDPTRQEEVRTVFLKVLDAAPEERNAVIEASCGSDWELRREVEELLGASQDADEVLWSLARRTRGPLTQAKTGFFAEGRRLGAYRLLQQIGQGGMGAVYLAERADRQFEKQVAIKLLPLGLSTGAARERFLAERQILAQLEHPGIAHLLDAGIAEDGTPFFVMEYVEGEPIDRYCERRDLGIAERIDLFLQVCGAVEYAHRNLVVHRDLKPGNILVTPEGVVKLLDFGIAKVLDAEAASGTTALTHQAGRPMTPAYASPEQVRGEPITTATDVYALGVLLYQLLAGRAPYQVQGLSPGDLERLICTQDPITPSAALLGCTAEAGHGAAAAASSAATSRRARRLRGDLDTIVLMALRKEPERRYGSVAALADDLVRHREGRPVDARPNRFAYRAGKFARRRPSAVAAGVAVLLAGGVYLGTLQAHAERLQQEHNVAQVERQRATTAQLRAEESQRVAEEERHRVQVERDRAESERRRAEAAQVLAEANHGRAEMEAVRAEAERDRAEEALQRSRVEIEKAEQVTAFLTGLFEGSDPAQSRGEDLTVRQVLDRGLAQADRLPVEAEVRAELLTVMGRVYGSLGLYDQALPLAEQALQLRREQFGEEHSAVAQSLSNLGSALWNDGDHNGAEQLYRQALAMQQRLLGDEHLDVAHTLHHLGRVLWNRRDVAGAEESLRRALALRQKLLGEEHPDVARSLQHLGVTLAVKSDRDGAEQALRQSLAMQERLYGEDHLDMVLTTHVLGEVLGNRGDLEAFEYWLRRGLSIQQKILGEEHPDIAFRMARLATVLRRTGDLDGSEAMFRQAIAMQRKLLGDEHPDVASTLNDFGNLLHAKGDLVEGEQVFREGLMVIRSAVSQDRISADAMMHGFLFHNLGNLLYSKRDFGAAEQAHREALAIRRSRSADSQPVAMSLRNVGLALQGGNDLAGAERLLRESLALWRRLVGAEHIRVAEGMRYLGVLLGEKGKYDEAESLLREALAMQIQLLGEENPDVAASLENIGLLYRERGEYQTAVSYLGNALDLRVRVLGEDHPDVATTRAHLEDVLARINPRSPR